MNPISESVVVPAELHIESDDEKLVMAELNENVHTVRGRLFSEIKHLKKFIPQKRRFDGYTSKTDNERLHMLAEYYREKRRCTSSPTFFVIAVACQNLCTVFLDFWLPFFHVQSNSSISESFIVYAH